jgi:hypothetical protein
MNFTDTKNTDLLWKTLYDSGKFAGYNTNQLKVSHSLFEQTIQDTIDLEACSLLDHNKQFIQVYLAKLSASNSIIEPSMYKQEDISNKRIAELDSLYKDKTEEFNIFTSEKPKDIDFSDTMNDPSIESLLHEILYNQTQILSYLSTDNQSSADNNLISLT